MIIKNEDGSRDQKETFWDIIKSIPIPEMVKNNAIVALSKGIGKLITSAVQIPVAYMDRKSKLVTAKGESEIKVMNAAAEAVSKIFSDDTDLANRSLMFFATKLLEEQSNREKVAVKTLRQLQSENVNEQQEKAIDEDWLTMFWNLAGTKTREDVQQILSRILTKEIVRPGSVSPITLQLLSVLTSDLGKAFQRLANLSIVEGETCYVIHPHVFPFQHIGPLTDYDISYQDLFDLDSAGLLRSGETIMLNYKNDLPFENINYAGQLGMLNYSGLQLHLIQFTRAGRELRDLLELKENRKYTEAIQLKLKDAFRIITHREKQ